MTPAARIAAAIGVLDRILDGTPAEPALIAWARASRFAGSGDRAALRDLVFEALRRRDSLAAMGGALSGRGLMLGLLRARGEDPARIFSGDRYAPEPLTDAEYEAGMPPEQADALTDMPEWLWPLWSGALGPQALPMAHAMRDRAPVWLRVNPRRGSVRKARAALAQEGIETIADDTHNLALRVTAGERRVAQSAPYRDGMVELQDLSPQLACAALPVAEGDRVLDYCAGGGGKSLALAAREDLRVTAHDADPGRMSDLPARARRAGVSIALSPPAQMGRDYDLVVADVPCSGSGTWRRTPDAKWRLTPHMLEGLQDTQRRILSDTAPLLRPGGQLAYMTCSLLDAENGDQIDAFLRDHPDFTEVARHRWTPLEASDGFFLSLLQRGTGAR